MDGWLYVNKDEIYFPAGVSYDSRETGSAPSAGSQRRENLLNTEIQMEEAGLEE